MSQSKGAYRVGTDFNPSGNPAVDELKRQAAELINTIEAIQPASKESERLRGEVARLKAHAQTLVEDAAMNAVKAATKREPQ